jgi:hypothetical protein
MPKNLRSGRPYQRARAALLAQGDAYCWRGCGTWLLADAPRWHPQFITLGHVIAVEDDPTQAMNPDNHRAECGPCNFGDGARRTNNKRAGRDGSTHYVNPNWL